MEAKTHTIATKWTQVGKKCSKENFDFFLEKRTHTQIRQGAFGS
jgi:hypothetical protein